MIKTGILIGKWIVQFNHKGKNAKIEAENTAGVVPPARLSNEDICIFDNDYVDKSISDKYDFNFR